MKEEVEEAMESAAEEIGSALDGMKEWVEDKLDGANGATNLFAIAV